MANSSADRWQCINEIVNSRPNSKLGNRSPAEVFTKSMSGDEQLIEDGYTPENAQKEIDVRTKADKDAKVNEMYTEWLDEKVIALQKEHGIYEERHIIDIDEEE